MKSMTDMGTMGKRMLPPSRGNSARKPMAFAKGGSVTRADGICKKGHTKGKMV
jgi:hypothetical protein